jgi:hypothetical protein
MANILQSQNQIQTGIILEHLIPNIFLGELKKKNGIKF